MEPTNLHNFERRLKGENRAPYKNTSRYIASRKKDLLNFLENIYTDLIGLQMKKEGMIQQKKRMK